MMAASSLKSPSSRSAPLLQHAPTEKSRSGSNRTRLRSALMAGPFGLGRGDASRWWAGPVAVRSHRTTPPRRPKRRYSSRRIAEVRLPAGAGGARGSRPSRSRRRPRCGSASGWCAGAGRRPGRRTAATCAGARRSGSTPSRGTQLVAARGPGRCRDGREADAADLAALGPQRGRPRVGWARGRRRARASWRSSICSAWTRPMTVHDSISSCAARGRRRRRCSRSAACRDGAQAAAARLGPAAEGDLVPAAGVDDRVRDRDLGALDRHDRPDDAVLDRHAWRTGAARSALAVPARPARRRGCG